MKAVVLNCTLKPSPRTSSTEALARVVIAELEKGGAEVEMIRLVDLDILPGVKGDMGRGDDWPSVDARLKAADIVVFATPTWLGQMSSVCLRALERLDPWFAETDDSGRPVARSPSARSPAWSSPAMRTGPTTSSPPSARA